MRCEIEQLFLVATLIGLRLSLNGRRPVAESNDQTAQRISFIDGEKLPVDQQLVASGRRATACPFHHESQHAQAVHDFAGQRILDINRDLPLPLRGILYGRLLAHDALIFRYLALTYSKVIHEDSRRPGQILFRSDNRISNPSLPARGKTETQQCAE